jgi:hypothetical protein
MDRGLSVGCAFSLGVIMVLGSVAACFGTGVIASLLYGPITGTTIATLVMLLFGFLIGALICWAILDR